MKLWHAPGTVTSTANDGYTSAGSIHIGKDGTVTWHPTGDTPATTAMDRAIGALHSQHTRDGRPSRFRPELE